MITFILISLTIVLSICLFLKWVTKNHDYFEKQGLKYQKPLPLIGTSSYLLTGDFIGGFQKQYDMFPNEKVFGTFELLKPAYFLRSPELIKQMTVKDFSYFQDRVTFLDDSSEDYFAKILFMLKGKQWRDMRSSLSPMFTGRKMRTMLELIYKCCDQLCDYLKEEYKKNGPTEYSTKLLFSKYANDVIATCAFGVEVNSLKNPKNVIYSIVTKILAGGKFTILLALRFMFLRLSPKIGTMLGIRVFPTDVSKKFTELITDTMEVRKRENIYRPDMLQLLMNLKDGQLIKSNEMDEIDPENKMINGEIRRNWSDHELIAQCFQFFVAGFHTTSSVLAFCSHALAVNPELQEKLIAEIDETQENLGGNPLSYEVLTKMKYMEMFLCEVLRMWPPVIVTNRQCKKSYTYEGGDGLKFSIQEGDAIVIPIYSLHMDPKYFPNPEKFDPERFNDQNRPNIDAHVYLPFGVGPRNCIAFRFALMEMKAVLFHMLLNFRFTVCKNTNIPVELSASTFGLVPKNDILQIIPREDTISKAC